MCLFEPKICAYNQCTNYLYKKIYKFSGTVAWVNIFILTHSSVWNRLQTGAARDGWLLSKYINTIVEILTIKA